MNSATSVCSRAAVSALLMGSAAVAAELHVAITGNNDNPGSAAAPFRTIQHAAEAAKPGDTITVHAGVYRERINPPRGGSSDTARITFQAAPGETVEITGAEPLRGWSKVGHATWKAVVPNSFFGGFNPFSDVIRGDWFSPGNRVHHTGAVYLNREWLTEAATRDEVMAAAGKTPLWFAEVGEAETTIWAQFKGVDPNRENVEVNARRAVFYPDKPGRNYITVRGFTLRCAATPWAPPTAEQVGLIGTHWSRGWVIENNVISHSTCSGITLGKHGDTFDNTSADSAEGYVETIKRAHAHPIPWTREAIGHHVVRNNRVSHCEQAGIVGSMGCAFSIVTGNTIHDVHVRQLFSGAEMAAIKFHGAIDTVISNNHIFRSNRGLWLDWMTQGTRVTSNIFHDNAPNEDLFVEVNHGPFLVDNNVLLSRSSLLDLSEGGAYVHNLIAGGIVWRAEPGRETPHHPPHSTVVAGLSITRGGDNRFYNNLFIARPDSLDEVTGWLGSQTHGKGYGLCAYDPAPPPTLTGGNVYLSGACAHKGEADAQRVDGSASWKLVQRDGHGWLQMSLPAVPLRHTRLVTSDLLGRTAVSKQPYVAADGAPLSIDRDCSGQSRDKAHPAPGPFEALRSGTREIQLW